MRGNFNGTFSFSSAGRFAKFLLVYTVPISQQFEFSIDLVCIQVYIGKKCANYISKT